MINLVDNKMARLRSTNTALKTKNINNRWTNNDDKTFSRQNVFLLSFNSLQHASTCLRTLTCSLRRRYTTDELCTVVYNICGRQYKNKTNVSHCQDVQLQKFNLIKSYKRKLLVCMRKKLVVLPAII